MFVDLAAAGHRDEERGRDGFKNKLPLAQTLDCKLGAAGEKARVAWPLRRDKRLYALEQVGGVDAQSLDRPADARPLLVQKGSSLALPQT